MKSLYILLALTFIPMFAAAQPHNENFLLDTAWEFKEENGRPYDYMYIYKYEMSLKIFEVKRFLFGDSKWDLIDSTYTEYDANGRLTYLARHSSLFSRTTYAYKYDAQGLIVSRSVLSYEDDTLTQGDSSVTYHDIYTSITDSYKYSSDEHQWRLLNRYTTTYSADSLIITNRTDSFFSDSIHNTYFYIKEYNSKGKLIISSSLNNKYDTVERTIYTYNEYDSLSEYVDEYLKDNEWLLRERETYEYDIYGNIILKFREYENAGIRYANKEVFEFKVKNLIRHEFYYKYADIWDTSYRYLFIYDNKDRLIQDLNQHWDGEWKNSLRRSYVYNDEGEKTNSLVEKWSDGKWQNTSRFIKQFKPDERKVVDYYQNWKDEWIDDYYDEFNYDENGNTILVRSEKFESNKWIKKIAYYQVDSQRSFTGYKIVLSYINKNDVAVEELPSTELNFTVSPNPATGKIAVSYFLEEPAAAAISIISMEGKTVYSMPEALQNPGMHNTQIDITHLQPGAYIISFTVGGRSSSKKIIITR